MQYEAFVESGKREIANIEKIFNAQMISRTGFVFEELINLEFDVRSEIQQRAAQINNPACIESANLQLTNTSEVAGANSMSAYQDVISQITFMRFIYVYPVLTELTNAKDNLAFEALGLISNINPVTNLDGIITNLTTELEFFIDLFESFVEEVIAEMNSFENFNRDLFLTLHNSLEETRSWFISSANDVRNFVNTCV